MSENTVESTIKKQINSLLKVDIVRKIKLDNYRFKISTHNEIDGFFLKNYLENNVFGYNYKILDGSKNITRIIEYDKNNLDIRIYNQMALMILFEHFNIDWDDNYLKDNERDTDIDKDKDKDRYYNAPFIYVKDKSGSRIPVLIITYLDNTESTSYLLLKKYYENMMQYISSIDFSYIIDDILNVNPENVALDNLGENIHTTIREIVSRLKGKYKKNTYIVYHLFDYRKDTHEISDTYKEPFKRTGHNKLGKYVMEELNTIVEISESESMLLKKNIDKMFNNFNTLTTVPTDSSSSLNSNSNSPITVELLDSNLSKSPVVKAAEKKANSTAVKAAVVNSKNVVVNPKVKAAAEGNSTVVAITKAEANLKAVTTA